MTGIFISPFAGAVAAAAATTPQGNGEVRILPNRILRVDGDGLAYYCAGKDGSDPADAKRAVLDKIRSAQRACGAGKVIVLLTATGSIKGGRYAVATVKPYQGQRVSSRRPDNWAFLRNFLESYDGPEFTVQISIDQEADDLFAQASNASMCPEDDCVIYTQDKDMRMIPGYHLNWVDHSVVKVPHGTWCIVHNEKVYGRKWFWLQMLHGDTADNIPGLYRMVVNGKEVKVGEVTANKILAVAKDEDEARSLVTEAYETYYGDKAEDHLAEQAQLLWMQRADDCMDAFCDGGPFEDQLGDGCHTVYNRIQEAQAINDLANKTQDN